MRPELEKYQEIDLYLNGKLSGTELENFHLKLKDSDFADEVDLQRQVNFVVESSVYDQIRDQIHNDIKKIDQRKSKYKNTLYGVVFLILISLTSLYLMNNKSKPVEPGVKESSKEVVFEKNGLDVPSVQSIPDSLTNTNNNQVSVKPKLKNIIYTKKAGNEIKDSEIPSSTEPDKIEQEMPTIAKALQETGAEIRSTVKDSVLKVVEDVACSGFILDQHPVIEASCLGKATGKVGFNLKSIKGGKAPYHLTGEGGIRPLFENKFQNLNGGEHMFYITDARGCVETVHIIVPEENCISNKYILNSSAGEVWQIPAQNDLYLLTIYDRGGKVVFKKKSDEIYMQQWSGMDLHGSFLDPGIYIYVIEYNDGKKQSGQVSIVK